MPERVARGELRFTGTTEPRPDRRPNFRGTITLERDLAAIAWRFLPDTSRRRIGQVEPCPAF